MFENVSSLDPIRWDTRSRCISKFFLTPASAVTATSMRLSGDIMNSERMVLTARTSSWREEKLAATSAFSRFVSGAGYGLTIMLRSAAGTSAPP